MIPLLVACLPLWYGFMAGRHQTHTITDSQKWNIVYNMILTQAMWLSHYINRNESLSFLVSLVWIPVVLFVQELWFYSLHRFFHYSKWLFNNIHYIHHTVYDSFYAWHAHPVEHLLLNIGSLAIPCLMIPLHNYILALLIYGQVMTSIIGHTPNDDNTRYHQKHHINMNTRFGNIRMLDKLLHTD